MIGTKRTHLAAAALMAAALVFLALAGSAGAKKRTTKADTPACAPVPADKTLASFPAGDAWLSAKRYKFPFYGAVPGSKKKNTVLWKKINSGSGARKTHYPAPNLPSCRVGRLGTEDRTSKKAARYFESLNPIDGKFNYELKDSFDRVVTTIRWEEESPIERLPQRWGWYVGSKWAGHDASRAFEVQGNACKLKVAPVVTLVNGAPVTTYQWVRDTDYVMIAFNPALGSPNRKWRPNQTGRLRVRAFVDRRALPGWLNFVANKYDFGCGGSTLTPRQAPATLVGPNFKSGYGAHRQYMIGQYFGESASPSDLLPGESKTHNNMPYNAYNPKPQFGGAMYAMNNTTGIAGGGMVRGIVRDGVDQITALDEMTYCDPNYTLRGLMLKRYGRRVSKWKYFELANFSRENKAAVRWVFGRIDPAKSTLAIEGQVANDNPASAHLYAWIPVTCDR